MKALSRTKLTLLWPAALLLAMTTRAYPPAPHHQFYGMVRDEFGTPLNLTAAEVVFLNASGTQLRATTVTPRAEPGVNYQMSIAMDSGITPAIYKQTAVLRNQNFRLQVRIGQTLYLPLEMAGNFSRMGGPGQRTRLDLTLGEDSDGDGIPDAWERALINLLGGSFTLADIRPGDDLDGDGLTNLQEYLAGTFAFDPADGFSLAVVTLNSEVAILEFLALNTRTYSIQESSDLKDWKSVAFRTVPGGSLLSHYSPPNVRQQRIEVPASAPATTNRFFRAMVQ